GVRPAALEPVAVDGGPLGDGADEEKAGGGIRHHVPGPVEQAPVSFDGYKPAALADPLAADHDDVDPACPLRLVQPLEAHAVRRNGRSLALQHRRAELPDDLLALVAVHRVAIARRAVMRDVAAEIHVAH